MTRRRQLTASARLWLVLAALLAVLGVALWVEPADAAPASHRSYACWTIAAELLEQGAPPAVAVRLAFVIAWRESGCVARAVHDRDDWSTSRFGLNGKTPGLRATWARWCGADVRSDTVALAVDVRCALAAYRVMGWRPWQ